MRPSLTPLNYLGLIGEIEVLPKIFDTVVIPPAVFDELQQDRTPRPVFEWAANLPRWARVQRPLAIDETIKLGRGEVEAIALAVELSADAVLIDERRGRLVAEAQGILAVGTLNILDTADRRGLLNLEEAVMKLRGTSFHVAKSLLKELVARARARKVSQ